jgi:D-alanyl-D-alanine carboxypeptidase
MIRAATKIPFSILATIASGTLGVFLFAAFLLYSGNQPLPLYSKTLLPKQVLIQDSDILATAAVLYDPKTKEVLYAKNGQVTLPLASLTKLMTAQVVLDHVSTSTLITLSKKDVSVEGDAGDLNLRAGDTMTLGSIIKLGLDASSNHAMSAAAASLGNEYIGDLNQTARELGLTHTYFLNSTGLDLDTEISGGYGSAIDMAKLTAAFMRDYPTYFEVSTRESVTVPVSGRQVTVKATGLPILDIPGIIGLKTGYTDLAGGNLVVAFDADVNRPLIAVVLGSTQKGRFQDMRVLINAARNQENKK